MGSNDHIPVPDPKPKKESVMYYTLDEDHVVHPAGRTLAEIGVEFADLWNITKRRVAVTEAGKAKVSTVFLVFDHSLGKPGPPVLFETMVFTGGEASDVCERCCTWDEAVEQHRRIVASLAVSLL